MNYKKAIAGAALVPLMGTSVFAADEMMNDEMMMTTTSAVTTSYDTSTMMGLHSAAANFLAEQNVIVDQSANVEMYNFTSNITRREMIKVAMNISGREVPETCTGEFSDLDASDFGCKYAEAALQAGFIANNDMFRPDDLITEAESLKMIMQARGIEKAEGDYEMWMLAYSDKAQAEGLIKTQINLDTNAKRGWIFDIAALAYPEFKAMVDAEVGVGVGGAMMLPSMDIVDNAMNADNVTTLVAAVSAAGLVDTLKSEGPFTVFAPTNDAFDDLPVGTVDTLLMEENQADLVNVLTYHVVAGAYTSADLTDGLTLTTVQGEELMFTINADGMLEINGEAMVETADVISSNGVTHVIDTVLMPAE